MRKAFICCVLFICTALTGCASLSTVNNGDTPQSSGWNLPVQMGTWHPQGEKLHADTMGLMEAFTKHEDLRALFVQAASGSLPLADITEASQYSFDDGTKAYYYSDRKGGVIRGGITDDSLRVDEKSADAIREIEARLPGVHVRMLDFEEGVICVAFTIVKNTTGGDYDYYEEDLIYSPNATWDKNDQIEEGWWFWSAPMP